MLGAALRLRKPDALIVSVARVLPRLPRGSGQSDDLPGAEVIGTTNQSLPSHRTAPVR